MADMPLFYKSIVPVDSNRHRSFRIKPADKPFGFAAGSHLVPAVIDEFVVASRELPIVFAPVGKRYAPVFLCGLTPGSNLFIDAEGKWDGGYVPAYLRRYPFMLGEREGAEPLVCVDPNFPGFVAGDIGERLFDDEGNISTQMSAIVQIVSDFAQAAKRTEALCDQLMRLDLLKTVSIDVKRGGGEKASIHGLSVIDEEKLGKLADKDFLELRQRGELAAVYAHLFSLGTTQALAAKLDRPKG